LFIENYNVKEIQNRRKRNSPACVSLSDNLNSFLARPFCKEDGLEKGCGRRKDGGKGRRETTEKLKSLANATSSEV